MEIVIQRAILQKKIAVVKPLQNYEETIYKSKVFCNIQSISISIDKL